MSAVDVAEIYSPPRFTAACGTRGLRPGFAVDLTTERPDGEHRETRPLDSYPRLGGLPVDMDVDTE